MMQYKIENLSPEQMEREEKSLKSLQGRVSRESLKSDIKKLSMAYEKQMPTDSLRGRIDATISTLKNAAYITDLESLYERIVDKYSVEPLRQQLKQAIEQSEKSVHLH